MLPKRLMFDRGEIAPVTETDALLGLLFVHSA
jgi:hypothetical protein